MPIRRTTTDSQLSQYYDSKVRILHRALVNNLIYVGEQAVREARKNGRYKDQTGNLRSSTGYCVVDDGKVIFESSFETVKKGDQGVKDGKDFLHRLISANSTGLVLIVVAGMEYAQYVEAKNLNVLDSAEQMSERLLPMLLKQLKL